MTKYNEPTVPIRIALSAALKGDWQRAENALTEALSLVRQRRAKAEREAAKA